MRRAWHTRLLAACVLLGGCEYDLDVGPPWQIDVPRVIAVRMVVVEPAPIWEERLGFDEGEVAPIAEALPGDVVQLQALAVNGEGQARAPESIDALWFQCGLDDDGPSGEVPCRIDLPACESIDQWTTDSSCELGRGGATQFTFPQLGPYGFRARSMPILGIIAREPGTDVERCRADFLSSPTDYSDELEHRPPASKYEDDSPACTAVEAHVLIGPRWALSFMAEEFGFEPEVPIEQIPYLLVYQPANRAPAPEPPVWVDAQTRVPLEGSPPRVRPGQSVRTAGPRWRDVDGQLYATAERVNYTESFVFLGGREGLGTFYFGSGNISDFYAQGDALYFTAAESTIPSTIRIVSIVGDWREDDAEYSAINMLVSELEVVP